MTKRRTLAQHFTQAQNALALDGGRSPRYQEAVEEYTRGMALMDARSRRGSAHRCFDRAIKMVQEESRA